MRASLHCDAGVGVLDDLNDNMNIPTINMVTSISAMTTPMFLVLLSFNRRADNI